MTPCDLWRNNLKAYTDGELPLKTRLAVRLHLLRCGDCRREINEMKDLSASLQANDAGTLDDALRTRILNAVPDAAPDVPNDLPPIRSRFPRKRLPLYAFGASAAALVGWFSLYPALNPALEKNRHGAASPQSAASDSSGQANEKLTAAEQSASLAAPNNSVATHPAPADAAAGSGAAPAGEADKLAEAPKPAIVQKTAGSGSDGYYFQKQENSGKKSAPSARAKSAAVSAEDSRRQVHREASLTLEVDKTEARSEMVSTMTKTAGGYVANDELQTQDDGTKIASLALKIPVAQFDSFLLQLARLGDVKAKSLFGEDITEKTSDQEQTTRIMGDDVKELETKVARARRASRHDEESLRQLRIREAQAQAHLKLLHNLGALADITVELREKPKPEPVKPQTGGFLNEMNATAHDASAAFSQAARLPIVLLIWAVVYLPLFLVLLAGYRLASRFWTRCDP